MRKPPKTLWVCPGLVTRWTVRKRTYLATNMKAGSPCYGCFLKPQCPGAVAYDIRADKEKK